nr:MAG TPA_asm: hypothetical protein [Caudoviricetes sp.]
MLPFCFSASPRLSLWIQVDLTAINLHTFLLDFSALLYYN